MPRSWAGSTISQILELRRPPRAEQLSERVLAGELVPVPVVRHPHGAHHAAELGREHDHPERWDQRHPGEQRSAEPSHRFCLAYVPTSCAAPSTWPFIAASTSGLSAPALSFRAASSAYSLKK